MTLDPPADSSAQPTAEGDERTPTGPEGRGWRGVVAFLLLAFGWSWGVWGPQALAAEGVIRAAPTLPAVGAFGPTVAAFVLVAYADGWSGVRRLAARAVRVDFPRRWLAPALLLAPALVVLALGVAFATDTAPSFPWAGSPVVLPVAFVFVLLLGGPVQEEFGWRGYLLDPLQERLSALGGGVAVGLIWALWHVPLFYVPSETIYYRRSFVGFAVSITLLSVLLTWLYNNTNGSLLPALLLHATWNWSQVMFPVLDSDPASLAMVVLLAVTTVGVVGYWGPSRLTRLPALPADLRPGR
ncbi:CPBP family intramembrane glutamic endopeptidase [Halobaculum marinum]|uniref:CPBP family intramembrane glutamic endopeptidase n=1 Tax=Halobaculum marinum TaxID=3031996 RepID=A0ABD5WRP1_9EURY|nr:type II CAAX endopeptidase family protein [Halobaculum sp. DT55]